MADILIGHIFERRPAHVLELGSGLSTLLMAYALEQTGGQLTAIEHAPYFLEKTQKLIDVHGIKNVQLLYCPLIPLGPKKQRFWYDIPLDQITQPVDFLFIDGPPGSTCPMARYPALRRLQQHLSDKVTIILDDANRPDEQKALERWQQEFPGISCELLPTIKGAAVLNRAANYITPYTGRR